MRVLVILDRGGVQGGHVVQAQSTASALESLGLTVTLSETADVDPRSYDVVHSFGAPAQLLREARAEGVGVAISPIWWSAEYTTGQSTSTRRSRALFGVRVAHSALRRGVHETARRLREPLVSKALAFELADVLLPNSRMEADQIRLDLGVTTPMVVVPNAVDVGAFASVAVDVNRSGVACVGRIEPHKNQLALIEALRGTGIPLTVAGFLHPDHTDYADRCRRRANASVRFMVGAPQEDIVHLYRSAAVHVLPSWFETTGLSSLEASAAGCAVVTTNRGFAREYFEDLALYCDPGEPDSIREAIRKALAEGPREGLREHVLRKYTWTEAARRTLEGYKLALAHRHPN
jgi:glycosyltransferase involved in cell wall biosynthesis